MTPQETKPTAEEQRLAEAKQDEAAQDNSKSKQINWRLRGTYLSERQ